MTWTGHITHVGVERNDYIVLVRKTLKEETPVGDLDKNWKITLKQVCRQLHLALIYMHLWSHRR
jgi:hypothetical protein